MSLDQIRSVEGGGHPGSSSPRSATGNEYVILLQNVNSSIFLNISEEIWVA